MQLSGMPYSLKGRRTLRPLAWVLLLGTLVSGCRALGPPLPPIPAPDGAWTEEGIASWYGRPFHGRRTASGEAYDMEAMTAAHPSLPFGTVVQVHNLENGLWTTVRINDRGPFVDGRIVDLSRRAAREIDMVGSGIARVRLVIATPPG
jgi:rare lipoprotein A